jgi:hypothetical protein
LIRKNIDLAEENDKPIFILVPARTDTAIWQDILFPKAYESGCIYFFRGRLTFKGAKDPAPFPSALVIIGKTGQKYKDIECMLTAGGFPGTLMA